MSKLKAQPTQQDWQKWLAANPFAPMRTTQVFEEREAPDTLECADLFCGAGGFSEGLRRRLQRAGVKLHLCCVNHWQTAMDTHKLMHPYADHVVKDVGDVLPLDMVPKGKLHLLLGSPPCQYHSLAGGARPMHEQGRMHPWLINRWFTDLDVERFICENVPPFLDWGPLCGLLDDHTGDHVACFGPDPEPICGEKPGRNDLSELRDAIEASTLPSGGQAQRVWRKLQKQAKKYGCALEPEHDGQHDWARELPPQPCGRPVEARKGEYFQAWIASLWLMGYQVEWKVLNAADFGGATTRKRLFIMGRKDGKPIRWPERTHAPAEVAARTRLDGKVLLPYRRARDVVDLDDKGESILERDRPLSDNTQQRMAKGLQRFGGTLAPLFLNLLDLSEKELAKYLTPHAWRAEQRPLVPFIMANRANNRPSPVDYPIPAITTSPSGGGNYLVQPSAEPFMLPQRTTGEPLSISQPIPTVTTVARVQLFDAQAEPFVVNRHGNESSHSVHDPVPTVTANGAGYLTTPGLLVPQHAGGAARPMDEPIPTVTGNGHGVAQPMILPYHQQSECYGVDEPIKTVSTKDDYGLVQPESLIVPYGPDADARPTSEPMHTIPTRDRLAVATPSSDPFLLNYHGDDRNGEARAPQSTYAPLTTMHAGGKSHALVQPSSEPFIVPHWRDRPTQEPRLHDIDEPLPTVTSRGAGNLVQPVLIQTDQTGSHGQCIRGVEQPLPTLHTKQNLGLVAPELVQPELTAVTPDMVGHIDPRRLVVIDGILHVLDIKYRMLKNPELARAMGFDDDEYHYQFVGTQTEITKEIGNAVEVHCADALVGAALYDLLPEPLEAVA